MGKATQSKTNPALLIGLVAVLAVAGAVAAYFLLSGGEGEPEFVATPQRPSAPPTEENRGEEADEEFDEDQVGYLEPEGEEEEEEGEETRVTRRRTRDRGFDRRPGEDDEDEEDEDEPREPRSFDTEDELEP